MKVKSLFTENYARNAASLRNWEDSRPEYPPEWDQEDFEPSDHGFEPFSEVWSDIQQFLQTGNNLPTIAQAVGTHPQSLFSRFRKEKRMAVLNARDNYGDDIDEIYYTDDVMGVLRVLKQIATNPSKDNNENIRQLDRAMAELTDDSNLYNHDQAEELVKDKHSDY